MDHRLTAGGFDVTAGSRIDRPCGRYCCFSRIAWRAIVSMLTDRPELVQEAKTIQPPKGVGFAHPRWATLNRQTCFKNATNSVLITATQRTTRHAWRTAKTAPGAKAPGSTEIKSWNDSRHGCGRNHSELFVNPSGQLCKACSSTARRAEPAENLGKSRENLAPNGLQIGLLTPRKPLKTKILRCLKAALNRQVVGSIPTASTK